MKRTHVWGLVTAGVLSVTSAAHAQTPSVAQMLNIQPKFDVSVSTPGAEEISSCRVDNIMVGGKAAGFALTDGRKQTLRRFYAARGGKMDTWSFYKDGVEVFRQHDANQDGKVDNYRWLGTGGMKWGVDLDQDGSIDAWRMISADEVAEEAFHALADRDYNRLKALSAEQAAAVAKAQQTAPQRFQQALSKLPNLSKATFLRVEGHPGCWTADATGASQDIVKFATRAVLYETADKKHDWVQTGEIVQIGALWRLLDVPGTFTNGMDDSDPELQKLLTQLGEIDKHMVAQTSPGPNPAVANYNEQRAALILKIVPLIKEPGERETWYKQIFDNLSAAVIAGSENAKKQLAGYREQLTTKMPGSNLAGYVVFRELWAEYQPKMAGPDFAKIQDEWHDRLAKFVKDYPQAEDTPEALNTLAMGTEFSGKEDEAVRWYRLIHTNFPQHPLAKHAEGAERRLKLVGNPLLLKGLTLQNNSEFDIGQLKGKIAVVYYWTSQCTSCPADFARFKQFLPNYAKDVELVCVNLDNRPEEAVRYLQSNPVQAIHVMQTGENGGLKGQLASYYGINILPTVFLVGRDGRVINHKLNVADLDEALRKAVQ
jgi:thiol-disulfide isomerase/thioredoxin